MKPLALFGLLFLGCATTIPATRVVGPTPTKTDTAKAREQTTRFDNAPMINTFHRRG